MSHLPNTNVWYKTLRIRRGSRFSYQLAPNDRPGETHYTAQTDPLNPRVAYGDSSIVETPDAPDESWYARTPVVRGSITKHSLESSLLKKRRDVSVYTPPGYSPSSGPYPLLILFDGQSQLDGRMQAPNTLDNLIAAHRIRPPVVCFVSDNRGVDREQTQTYSSAMATELVPWLRSSYAISADPKDVVIGGYSAGGGAAGVTAFYYPGVFGNVLLQSGGIQVLVPLLMNASKLPVRFYLDQGLYEYGPTWAALSPDEQAVEGWFDEGIPPQGQNWLLRARLLRTVLQAKGYDAQYHETGGGHEFVHWRATLAEGLMALLGPSNK
ncbi:MAG TPA: alpha/beta hydrolase-fold protein [Bryobacteraceae bacterium]|jgi:enterochelin esterase family protein